MKSNILDTLLKETSLDIRFEVSIQAAFIDLLSELGYREDKMWTDDEDEILIKISHLAKELSKDHIRIIDEWERDIN